MKAAAEVSQLGQRFEAGRSPLSELPRINDDEALDLRLAPFMAKG